MKNVKKRSNQGITLIALIITIIVLLILAGISIATLIGENGILTKANDAKEKSIVAEESEIIKLAYTTLLTDKKVEGTEMTTSNLQKEISKTKTATVEEVNEIPEGANIIENGATKGTKCKVTMEKVYYMYLGNEIIPQFSIELYNGEELVETLPFNFEEGMDLKTWFNSKYCVGISDYSYSEYYPGGQAMIGDFNFARNGTSYNIELLLWSIDEGDTNEDILAEGIIYKAEKIGE